MTDSDYQERNDVERSHRQWNTTEPSETQHLDEAPPLAHTED